jgi:hypothetical protein
MTFECKLQFGCVRRPADFMNTSLFGQTLPDGVTMTSDSGVFLTPVSSVPEPASLGRLAGIAMAAFGLLRLRRCST